MDTWWIEQNRILGSANPSADDIEKLRQQGCTCILSFLCEDEPPAGYDIEAARKSGYDVRNIHVRDHCAPTVEQLLEFVNLVRDLGSEDRIVIHCQGGNGRTGTFGAAYWIAKGMSASDVIRKMRQLRPYAIETKEQEEILYEFEEYLKRR
jgi:atypical dual specificity phosphatase